MTRALLIATLAILLGLGSAEYLTRNIAFRRWLGEIVRRGELQALVGRRGLYDNDVERAWQAELFAQGREPHEIEKATAAGQKRAALQRLFDQEKLNAAAAGEPLDSAVVDREMNLLRWQFRDEKTWQQVLQRAATSPSRLRREAARNLRARTWIENQIAPRIRSDEEECRRYFEMHRPSFAEPLRLRASHLFLAAPEGYPEEIIETKRALIDDLAKRLANGEAFPALVAEFSEDEATRKRGGDLGYFAAERMLPEVFEAAQRLHPGETSAPIRSRLGFHLVRLTTVLPARNLTLTEATPEIRTTIENTRRLKSVEALLAALRETR